MPKNIHNIKTFLTGIVSSPDAKDIPEDAAESSLNIDPVSSDGRLQSIGGDEQIVDNQADSTPEIMDFVNVNGKRLLVGASDSKILTLDNFHDINEPTDFKETNIDNVLNPSIVVYNNESYVGLGGIGADSPKFVGKVLNSNITGTTSESVVIEDAENKSFRGSYYKIEKLATTIPSDDSFGCSKSEELKYIWGVGNGDKFLYKLTVDQSATAGTIEISNIIKDSDGQNIDTNIVSIATCISQNNMLWATGEDKNIYRLHVNSSTNNITIESKIVPFYLKDDENGDAEEFNKHNKKPPEDAILSDIIEAKSSDGTASELVISFYKEEGFVARDSYMYSRKIINFDSSDTVIEGESLDNINNFLSETEIITRFYNSNFLFKDVSVIFDDVELVETGENANRTLALRKTNGFNNIKNCKTTLLNSDFQGGFSTFFYSKIDGYHKTENEFNYNDLNLDSFNGNNHMVGILENDDNFNILEATSADSGKVYDLGRNLGFLSGFKLHVAKFGLISTDSNTQTDVQVHLYAYSDKDYVFKGGLFENITSGGVNKFVGILNHEQVFYSGGFFISVKANLKDKPFYENKIFEDSPTDIAYASSVPSGTNHGEDNNEIGHAIISSITTDETINGSITNQTFFNNQLLVESIGLDRFGDRNAVTTTTNYDPIANHNIGFLSLSRQSSGSNSIDSNVLIPIDFDTINLNGGDNNFGFLSDGNPNLKPTGLDNLLLIKTDTNTFESPKVTSDLGGSCIFPVFNTATGNGGHGTDHFRIWQLGLHSQGSQNYRNGIQNLVDSNADFNTFDSDFVQKISATYASLVATDIASTSNISFAASSKLFYKVAVVFQNGSVSKLSLKEWEHVVGSSDVESIQIVFKLNKNDISPRAVGLQLYRRGIDANGDKETQYHLAMNDISLLSGWSEISGTNFVSKTIFDQGEQIGLYQDISGLSLNDVTLTTLPNYGISTTINNKNIIGHCFTIEQGNMPNRLFASLPGRYNSFKIDDELNTLLLPSKPTAIKGFNGRLFAFEENKMFIINTDAMIIEDELEGIGCLSQESVVVTEFGMFTANNSNIYHYTGENTIPIASSILKSNNNIGWLEREPTFNPLVAFNSKRDSLIVVFRQKNILSDDEINAIVEEILESGNPDNLSVFEIIEGLSPYFAWVYNLRLKRWDLWELPSKAPKAIVADKNGDIIISTDQGLFKYATDEDNKRKWEWVSKQITLGEDNKSKKYYKVKTHSNTDEEFLQYSVDKGEFIEGLNINKKAKSLQIKIDSEDPNLEVDSISIPYRNLPNSKQNL